MSKEITEELNKILGECTLSLCNEHEAMMCSRCKVEELFKIQSQSHQKEMEALVWEINDEIETQQKITTSNTNPHVPIYIIKEKLEEIAQKHNIKV